MNNFFIALTLTSIAGLSTLIGFLILLIEIKNTNKFISFILSFSFTIMLLISIFDLIPTALGLLNVKSSITGITLFTVVFILSSKLFNYIESRVLNKKNSLYNIGIMSLIVLLIHNIFEGMLTFSSSYTNFSLGLKICILIALHNIPEGISIAVPIYYATKKKGRALIFVLVSSLTEVISGVLSFIFLHKFIQLNTFNGILMIFTASLMIFLSVFELYPESLSYNEKKSMFYGFIIGLLIFIINIIL